MTEGPRRRAGVTRRSLLKTIAAADLCAALQSIGFGQTSAPVAVGGREVAAYLATLARPGGGIAWDEQTEPHLTPTFAAIGCYHLLWIEPPDRDGLA